MAGVLYFTVDHDPVVPTSLGLKEGTRRDDASSGGSSIVVVAVAVALIMIMVYPCVVYPCVVGGGCVATCRICPLELCRCLGSTQAAMGGSAGPQLSGTR